MSLLVNENGSLKTYAVVDNRTRTVVAAFNYVQQAHKGFIELQKARKDGADDLAFHNITHPMGPDWLQEIVRSDQDYCSQMAKDFDKGAAALRRKAADLVAQAEGLERHAAEWRELFESASVPSSPGL
jgi:hypothetical protein